MVRGRYRVGVSKTKTKEKIMMKKKVMPLSCLMAAAMLAGCGTAAPAVPEETTAPAVETAEAAQETAPADAAESEAAAVEKTAGVWQVEPCYNFDEIVPLYSEWDHTAGKNAADGLYAVRDGERWSLFSTKTGNIMMQDAAQQMPYLYGTNELSVWLDDEYYNYDNFAAMREKCEGLNAELQANGAEIEVLYDGVGGYANRWIYTEDGQIYYDLLGTYEFSGTPLVQVSDASALFGVRPATWDNEYRCYTVANGAPYAVARSDGSLLSSFRYKNVCMAGDELIAVEDTDGNWGYCDINGEEVIPCTYQAAMQAEGASEPIDYPFPDMSGVVVVQDADGARMALYTDGTVCIEAGRFEDLAPAQRARPYVPHIEDECIQGHVLVVVIINTTILSMTAVTFHQLFPLGSRIGMGLCIRQNRQVTVHQVDDIVREGLFPGKLCPIFQAELFGALRRTADKFTHDAPPAVLAGLYGKETREVKLIQVDFCCVSVAVNGFVWHHRDYPPCFLFVLTWIQ